ncbi:hypothetical protein Nepgr_025608 [Nepenthes gracilis]|uniref:DNA-3-methyladenine glycosylase I n=1 Tax=Nepenthes gracilis TaxID=150966 RepID=A0AAD3T5E3_NEPGR|nr:hypothetical protein Nepgr_025608 [Nepenthes gracilis]
MSIATEIQLPTKSVKDARKILDQDGNGARIQEKTATKQGKKQSANMKKQRKPPARAMVPEILDPSLRKNASVESPNSSDSHSSSLSAASASRRSSRARVKPNRAINSVKVVPCGPETAIPIISGPIKRCDWITPHSDPLYRSFHDEEWGIPTRSDRKLFEFLVLSVALAEHTWLSILSKRDAFRELFDDFNPSSIANFSEETLLSRNTHGPALLSEPKLRAIVENAKQMLKIQDEFGSFSNYCRRFLNHRPTLNGFRYAHQVPVKTPKAEFISKDLMRRGFRCAGPTVVYSFMQVSGMVNDHLITCFRYEQCRPNPKEFEEVDKHLS